MSGLERLGERVAREQDLLRERDATESRVALRDLVARAELKRSRPSPHWFWLVPSVAAALLLGLLLRIEHERALTVVAGSKAAKIVAGTFIEAPAREALRMTFSDGSRIEMAPQTRARLVELDQNGAHLSLESGLAHVQVKHRSETHYLLSAGPFRVLVTGTRFDLGWNPDDDAFELDLREGQVEVSGCAFGPGYRMHAGQRVHASCKQREFAVSESTADAKPEAQAVAPAARSSTPLAHPSASVAGADLGHAVHGRSLRNGATPERGDWIGLAQEGSYVKAFAAANAVGFESQCARANAHELTMLADAARFAGATKREAYALQALRRRFPGTESAAIAAFALGRLEFDRHGAYQKAAQWFETYLNERPHGALSREARGRLIETTVRAGDFSRARALADAYVRDYPGGPHANLARSLQASSD